MINTICQILIVVLGMTSIWFLAQKKPWARWGYVLGLLAEPFWLYTAWVNKQWGVVFLVFWYTYAFSLGIFNHFGGKHEM